MRHPLKGVKGIFIILFIVFHLKVERKTFMSFLSLIPFTFYFKGIYLLLLPPVNREKLLEFSLYLFILHFFNGFCSLLII